MLLIGNKGSIVEYRNWQNEFNRSSGTLSASFSPDAQRGGGIGEMLYDTIDAGVTFAQSQRRQTVTIDGQAIECIVLQVRYAGPDGPIVFTFWIDEQHQTVLRRVFEGVRPDGRLQTTSSTVTSLRIDAQLPEDLFLFVPPPGAHEVRSISGQQTAAQKTSTIRPDAK
jgi:hypothetical protein